MIVVLHLTVTLKLYRLYMTKIFVCVHCSVSFRESSSGL